MEVVHLAIDDHSRLAYSEILPDEKRGSCLRFLFDALRFFRSLGVKVERVMTDNGASFRSRRYAKAMRLLKIKHLRTKPKTNGKAERFVQTSLREWGYARAYGAPRRRANALHELFKLGLRSCMFVREGGEHDQQRARIVIISTAFAGSAAFAQTNDAGSQGNASTYQPVHKATVPAADQPADMFVTKQAVTEWRAPKLVGVSVYGVDDKKVGTIKDVLVDHDGSARVIVIGVGGFLGIRARDIGVPFSAIQWQTEGCVVPATDQPPANPLAITDSGSNQPTVKNGSSGDRSEPRPSGQGGSQGDLGPVEDGARL
jgi:sporulation protein YlmC with PRC-barrel domain